jgi:hypothetical protein
MTMQTLEFIPRCVLCGQHCWGVPGECDAADKRQERAT